MIFDLRKTNCRIYVGHPLGASARSRGIEPHWQLLEAVTATDAENAKKILIEHFDLSKEREK